MSRKPFFLSNWPLWLIGAFLVLWWLAPIGWRALTRDIFAGFQAPLWAAHARMSDLQSYWAMRAHSQNELIEAGRDLARMNAFKENQIQQNASLQAEVKRLEDLLRLPPHMGYRYEVARVMRRDIDTWWQQLLIRKGAEDGLAPGMGVVFEGGVVGRVREVSAHTAIVDLVSSRLFRMAANLEGDGRPFTYQGLHTLPLETPQGEVRDVPPGIPMSTGETRRIVTSGLGGVFPEGLTLGTVDVLEHGNDGLFLRGQIKLDPRLMDLQEVSVLVPIGAP